MTVLIITSSAGGGHLVAAQAMKHRLQSQAKHAIDFIQIDLLKKWLPHFLGSFKTNQWNKAQLRGSVFWLNWFGRQQTAIDTLLYFPVLFGFFRALCKYQPEKVIDTQPLSTKALIHAIRLYEYFYGKKIVLEKVLTDLPTTKAQHFFSRIKKLSKKDSSYILLLSTPLMYSEHAERFWKKQTGLPLERIRIISFLLRKGFYAYINKKKQGDYFTLRFMYEKKKKVFLQKKYGNNRNISWRKQQVALRIAKQDLLVTILLGSYPPKKAVLSYLASILNMACAYPKKNIYCQVCCGENRLLEDLLWKQMEIQKISNLFVFPLGQQSDKTIARLFHWSDILFTKSGGQTTMELLATANGKILIHSENKENLVAGISGWEVANANWLIEKKNAQIVHPLTVDEEFLRPFCVN